MQTKPFRLPAPLNQSCEYKDKPCTEPAYWTVWKSGTQVAGHYCKNHSGRVLERIEREAEEQISQRS